MGDLYYVPLPWYMIMKILWIVKNPFGANCHNYNENFYGSCKKHVGRNRNLIINFNLLGLNKSIHKRLIIINSIMIGANFLENRIILSNKAITFKCPGAVNDLQFKDDSYNFL